MDARWAILLVAAAVVRGAAAAEPAPGAAEHCNVTDACLPFKERGQLSFDFLCCEDSPWVAAHVTHPLGLYVFVGSFFPVGFAVLAFEAFEITALVLFSSFLLFETNELEFETWAGSLLGDGVLQGGQGMLIGALLLYVFDMPSLVPRDRRAPALLWWKYAALCLLHSALFAFAGRVQGEQRVGLVVTTLGLMLYIFFVLPVVTSSAADERFVWRRGTVSASRRRLFFGVWAAVVGVINVQLLVPDYLPNGWYQSWASTVPLIVLLALAAAVKRARAQRRRARRVK